MLAWRAINTKLPCLKNFYSEIKKCNAMVSSPKGGVDFKKSYLLFAFSDVNIKDTIMKIVFYFKLGLRNRCVLCFLYLAYNFESKIINMMISMPIRV